MIVNIYHFLLLKKMTCTSLGKMLWRPNMIVNIYNFLLLKKMTCTSLGENKKRCQ